MNSNPEDAVFTEDDVLGVIDRGGIVDYDALYGGDFNGALTGFSSRIVTSAPTLGSSPLRQEVDTWPYMQGYE